MARVPDIFSSVIVANGDFNPAIFTPDWLERNNLIGPEDANEARQSQSIVVTRQVSVVETDWFVLQVLEEQMTLSSKGALSPTLKDLAVSIFSLVAQTPVRAFGMNFFGDYKMATVADYHKVGDVLAPKDIWHKIFPPNDFNTGMMNLVMRVTPGARELGNPTSNDHKNVTIQNSVRVAGGIHMQMNDHRDISAFDDHELTKAEYAAKIIDEQWQKSWEEAVSVFDQLLSSVLVS